MSRPRGAGGGRWRPRGAVLAALAGLLGGCVSTGPVAGAMFEDADALAVTPDGTLWVVDRGAATVVALREGIEVDRLGGAGTSDEAFLDPVDVDPTNGQTVVVADRAAGMIHQFTAEGRLAVSLIVPDVDPARPRQPLASRDGRRGQPVAVAAAADGMFYVADAGRSHVLYLSSEGDAERVLGSSGPGALVEPVDLAVTGEGTVWVADAGRGVLQPFDSFGAAGASVAVRDLGRLVSVIDGPTGLVVAGERAVAIVRGGSLVAGPIEVAEPPLRGAVVLDGAIVFLTSTRVGVYRDAVLD